MIRSSKHTLKYANKSKKEDLKIFLTEYRRLLQKVVDYLWATPTQQLNIPNNKLHCPKFLETETLNLFDTWLHARMKQCVGKQACAMVSSATSKRRKQLYVLRKKQREHKNTKHLQQRIDKYPLVRPNASNVKAELDIRLIDTQEGNSFDEFIKIIRQGTRATTNVPLKYTKASLKWAAKGKRTAGIRLSEDYLTLMFKVSEARITGKKTVGADQGQVTCLTMSDKQVTPKQYPHRKVHQKPLKAHDLTSIQEILKRRKKASRGFRRAQAHRINYINWSLNQLDFKDIKEVRFERVKNVRKGKRTNRKNSHWLYTAIKDKMIHLSETEGFRFIEVTNEFRSQRCSGCGWVHKANRKKKAFLCNLCGFTMDADLNASYNLELTLCELPWWVRAGGLNRTTGFYWLEDDFYDINHECIVRDGPVLSEL